MKRSLLALAIVAAAVPSWAQGPDEKGATLKQPWDNAAPKAAPLQGLWNGAATGTRPAPRTPLPAQPAVAPDINKDIEVTPSLGPWLISIISYTGEQAPLQARQMVGELRGKYKLHAYVFNHGAEERRQERERVNKQIEAQRAKLEATRKEFPDLPIGAMPIRVKRLAHAEEHCAVLVGGYRDEAAARAALDAIRALKPEQLERRLLEAKFYRVPDPMTGQVKEEYVYANPFTRAFPVPNPSIKRERVADDKIDIEALRKLNVGVPYSLLECNKRYTLAIKQFQTPAGVVAGNEAKGNFLNLFTKASPRDLAAENATTLTEALRTAYKLEAYVLHTRCASFVTVGGFDSVDDPNLRAMQNNLATYLLPLQAANVQLLPQPAPMEVPH